MRLQLKTKNGRKLRIFFMKRIRGAGCVVRVTGPTDRPGESVTAERETAPVDMFQAGQILSVITRETYTVSKLPKQRRRLTASLAQSGGRSAISSARLVGSGVRSWTTVAVFFRSK